MPNSLRRCAIWVTESVVPSIPAVRLLRSSQATRTRMSTRGESSGVGSSSTSGDRAISPPGRQSARDPAPTPSRGGLTLGGRTRSGRRNTTLAAGVVGGRRVVGVPGGAPVLLHLGLEEVSAAPDQLLAGQPLEGLEGVVVAVVVLLDDLEAPAPVEHVPAHEVAFEAVGEVGVAGLAQLLDGLPEGEVRRAAEAVEGVQVAARVLDRLERLGELAQGLDGGVADALGAPVLGDGPVGQRASRAAIRAGGSATVTVAPG